VDECRERLEATDGYFGIFAYYYGWMPEGWEKSITHLEYAWVCDKWGRRRPPRVAVFMPGSRHPSAASGPCEAERELRQIAEGLVQNYHGGPEFHARKLAEFHDEVSGQGRTCNYFSNLAELRESAITKGFQWQGGLAAAAAQARPEKGTAPAFSEAQLGLMGRTRQMEAMRDILDQLALDSAAPAACVVAFGREESGQAEFLAALAEAPELRRARPPVKGRPPLIQYTVPELILWMANCLCALEEHGPPVETIDQLAASLHRSLRDQTAVLLLDRIERLEGGLARFFSDLWQPLYEALAQRCAVIPVDHRLILVVAAYTPRRPGWGQFTAGWDPGTMLDDFRRLVCLPELGDMDAKALARWLREIGLEGTPAQVQAISKAVLTDAEGNADGTPERVYRRLKDLPL
jgi:hypothetical protein